MSILISMAELIYILSNFIAVILACIFIYYYNRGRPEMVSGNTTLMGGNFITSIIIVMIAYLPFFIYDPESAGIPPNFYTKFWIILLLEILAGFVIFSIIKIPLNLLANFRAIPAFLAFFVFASWDVITLEAMAVSVHSVDLMDKILGIVMVVYLVVYFIAPIYILSLVPSKVLHTSNSTS